MLRLALAACMASTVSPAAWAQSEPAMTRRGTEVRELASAASRSLAVLPERTSVTRLSERQGAWVHVRTVDGITGWVHLFDLGPAGAPTSSGAFAGALRGVTSLFSKGGPSAGSTVSTSTVGVRGLGAEDLANAQPNPEAVTSMETLRQSEVQAREFARTAGIKPVDVETLVSSESSH